MWSDSVVFFTRPSLSTGIDFDVPVSVISIKSNAARVDEIPLSHF
jgi:hypothetical protein